MTSLFLTGASGFLGSALLEKLEPAHYDTVTLLSRREISLPARLKNADNVRQIRASIDDVDQYKAAFSPDTFIVHLAAVTGKAAPETYFSVNSDGTRLLVDSAKNSGVRNFLFVSSIAVSFKDRKGYFYADSKEQAENYLRDSGLKYRIFRPTIILGRDSPIWASFVKLASASTIVLPGNGKVRIQPIYIEDMVDLLLDAVNGAEFDNMTLEAGGPEVLTMDDFVTRIHTAIKGKRPRILHLPLGMLVFSLRLFEQVFPSLLPVNSGQFSSFRNDGTAADNEFVHAHSQNMKDVAAMLAHMLGDARDD